VGRDDFLHVVMRCISAANPPRRPTAEAGSPASFGSRVRRQDPAVHGSRSGSVPPCAHRLLELTRYPILADRIRERMRHELFQRGVIARDTFENEVQEKARESQLREGLTDPLTQESPDLWQQRVWITRQQLTDFYFAYNLPHDCSRTSCGRRWPTAARRRCHADLSPELAPWTCCSPRGGLRGAPPPERARMQHHLEEIKVVLIKAMISDHLSYVGIARRWFEIADLQAIERGASAEARSAERRPG